VTAHQKENTRSSIDAGKDAGEETDDCANIDKKPERGKTCPISENIERRRAFVECFTVPLYKGTGSLGNMVIG
jgi:hypothetical protein